jgi:ATP-dependent exoDNAse (exonuclease V) alpha subunit
MTQQEAITLLKMGKNVFLTGPAGSGKTYVLNSYISYLRERGVEVAVTASTGIAATHIGGMTIHGWSGIGIKDTLSAQDLDYLESHQYLWKRFEKVKVLVVDEISMLKNSTLDMVDRVCKAFKRNEKPFGGLQVIFSGDFFQLPPIERYSPKAQMEQIALYPTNNEDIMYEVEDEIQTPFAFTAKSWKNADLHVCYLKEQHRQDDSTLLNILNEIRSGEVSDDVRELLLEKITQTDIEDVTKLYTHNIDVDRYNLEQLEKIDGEEQIYEMTSHGKASGVEALKRGCLSPEELWVKVGALVMFVKNNPIAGYVNGTMGEVIGFNTDGFPVVQTKEGREFVAIPQPWAIEDQGKVLAEIYQVPLRLAWAVTIHKSQGMTLDSAHIDLSQAFVAGQGYVALSRVRTLEGLYLKGINRQALEVHPGVLRFDEKLQELSDIMTSRLEKTDQKRIDECINEFLKYVGGDANFVPKKKKEKEIKGGKVITKTTYEITKDFILQKKSVKEISSEREISEGTILEHVDKLIQEQMLTYADIEYLKPSKAKEKKDFEKIIKAFEKLETTKLKPVFEHFEEKHDYDVIKLAKLFIVNKTPQK